MSVDIITRCTTDAKDNEIIHRTAIGKVNNKNVRLVLQQNVIYTKGFFVRCFEDDNIIGNGEYFSSQFFADRYFDKLIKKYNLKEKIE